VLTVLRAEKGNDPFYRAHLAAAPDVMLVAESDPTDRKRIVWGPVRYERVDSDAELLIVEVQRLDLE